MAGPVLPPPSWPGLSRPSTSSFVAASRKQDVDARHKAGHDEGTEAGHGERVEAGHGEGMEAGHDERVEGMTKGGQVMAVAMSRMRAATAVTLPPPSWPGPAIHVFLCRRLQGSKTWMPGTKAGHDEGVEAGHGEGVEAGHGERAEAGHGEGTEAGHDERVEGGHPVFTGMAAKAAMPWLDHPPSRVMTFAEGHACARGARR
jgi:hypothetical protein